MRLYNTRARQVEEIKPLNPPQVTIYSCGPTVYDYAHIGHWFTYIRTDTLIRALKAAGLQPKWVMNITDVGHLTSDADEGEDKLEKGAQREGKTAWEIADFYTKDFLKGMRQLNMLRPDHLPRATDHIPEQIELIKKLEAKDYTYIIDDGVYYDTAKFAGYADFAKLELAEQQSTERVNVNPQKRQPPDFALWKFSPKGHQRDMEWDSPWGKGFPGWHIECSAMSMQYLGQTLDIHTGGIDHIPVHHTNEIAQSEAATGKRFANHWLHSNHVLVNGAKISKSLGNGIGLPAIIAKGIVPEAVRLHVLESHYRSQAKFSWDSLQAAQTRLKSYQALADLQFQPIGEARWLTSARSLDGIKSAVFDDLNTPVALSELSQLTAEAEVKLLTEAELEAFTQLLSELDELFGLNLAQRSDISTAQKELIAVREQARQRQDFDKSDEIRDQLTKQGLGLRDTPQGAIWFRL